ncbi:hypothetical protein O6H91_17G027000 [Diphasiastrum complanatum]|uniref:Uncharacterized protein n=1 Tax=Diphasiastrum complanatum TaxID=34168 RepID=A0ACC2B589_DIPCM|nr:hypothetical protein O6H91_17G027000 [Diphasiastrum complanatum]
MGLTHLLGIPAEKLLSIALTFVVSLYSSPEEISLKYTTPPTWLKSDVARHLEDPALFMGDVIVSKDGSGHYSKIQDAVDAAPIKSKKRYTIYIKGGVYLENVDVSKSKTNLMFVGDGIGQTIISGNKNVVDGATTFTSATVAVTGNGFLARDITFRNTAGAAKHQAVALRVGADQAAFYKCSFEGYQDTLYTHSQRQFYRQCMIYGTVDYIFGNAAALFQDSTLLARVPLAQQKNTYTAQGRTDPNQNTGLVFQGSVVDGDSNLRKVIQNFPTYLGRPWKEYSRTVFLKSYEGSVINPAGWLEWAGDFALKTLFYGEYQCTGPGSGSAQRFSWSSQITSQAVANCEKQNALGFNL